MNLLSYDFRRIKDTDRKKALNNIRHLKKKTDRPTYIGKYKMIAGSGMEVDVFWRTSMLETNNDNFFACLGKLLLPPLNK